MTFAVSDLQPGDRIVWEQGDQPAPCVLGVGPCVSTGTVIRPLTAAEAAYAGLSPDEWVWSAPDGHVQGFPGHVRASQVLVVHRAAMVNQEMLALYLPEQLPVDSPPA